MHDRKGRSLEELIFLFQNLNDLGGRNSFGIVDVKHSFQDFHHSWGQVDFRVILSFNDLV